jgi:hypothetical protein
MAGRTTRITIETERILIIARQQLVRGGCERCRNEVEFLSSDHARPMLDTISGSLEEQERNSLHQWPPKDGLIFVCVKALLRFLQAASGQRNS